MSFMKARLGWIAVLVLAGFTAVPASAQTTLRYQFKEGEKLPYVMDQKMVMTMNVMGNEVKVDMNQTVDITWSISAVDKDGKAKMTQKMDRVRFVMDGPTGKVAFDSKDGKEPEGPVGQVVGPILKAMAGSEFSLTMDPQGRTSDVKVPGKLLDALKASPATASVGDIFSEEGMKRMVGQGGLLLPAEPVTKGKTWDQKMELKSPFGMMKVENKLTDKGPVMRGDKKVEEISLQPTLTFEADPNAQATIKLKNQSSKGNAFFDNAAGRLLETDLTQNMDMEISVAGQTISQKIEQTVTLKLSGDTK